MKYLKPYQHYADLYDQHTVERCRRTEQSFGQTDDIPLPKKMSKDQAVRIKEFAKRWYLRTQSGERYLNRAKTIQEWMEADEKRDQLLE